MLKTIGEKRVFKWKQRTENEWVREDGIKVQYDDGVVSGLTFFVVKPWIIVNPWLSEITIAEYTDDDARLIRFKTAESAMCRADLVVDEITEEDRHEWSVYIFRQAVSRFVNFYVAGNANRLHVADLIRTLKQVRNHTRKEDVPHQEDVAASDDSLYEKLIAKLNIKD